MQSIEVVIERVKALTERNSASTVVPSIKELIKSNVFKLDPASISRHSLEAFVRGAFRTIGDSVDAPDDGDPLISALLLLDSLASSLETSEG